MNRVLADTLAFFNAFIAIVLFAACAFLGFRLITFAGPGVGLVIGALGGLALSAFICGTIAFVALIESHLRTLAEGGTDRGSTRDASSLTAMRQEPSL